MRKNILRKRLVFILVLLYVGIGVVQQTITNVKADFTNGLVGYWSFNEGSGNISYDSSGNNNDAMIYGASWSGGVFGFGLTYDGQDDYVEVPIISNITNIPLNEITFQCWVYLGDNTENPQQIIEGHTIVHEINIERLAGTSIIQFDVVDDNGVLHHITTSPLPLNYWTHLVAVIDGTAQYIYVNGEFNNASSWASPFTITTGFSIGKDYEAAGQYYLGTLDDFRIYSRGLTEEEIWELYSPSMVYIDDDYNSSIPGWGYDHFDKTQYGIDAVDFGGTVYVYNGIYYENVFINKTINLIGEDKDTTVIDGNGSGDVVYIYADNVNIEGFTIQNSGSVYNNAGILVTSENNSISSNIISFNKNHGILLYSSCNNKVINNTVIQNNNEGIQLESNSKDNVVTGNNISFNSDGGIDIVYGSSYNIITDNIISNNIDGIYFLESGNNNIVNNTISNHSDKGIWSSFYSNNNIIYHNNLMNNTMNAEDESGSIWNDTYPYGGNHWSDYWGNDLYSGPNQDIPGSDGIGDTPYEIPCEHGTDYYPLMHPFEMYYILDIIPENNIINESNVFNVTVKSLGGTRIPDALVEFNDELILTDSNGTVWFTAPQVETDTYYEITATKTGYTGANETILIRNVPSEFKNALIFGRIANLTTVDDTIVFEAVNIKVVTFKPFSFNPYTSGEQFIISKDYKGLLGYRFILVFCKILF